MTRLNNYKTSFMISPETFEQSLKNGQAPQGISVYLQSLWHDAHGDWQSAHDLVDSLPGSKAAAVHAYLHRVEGDHWNANYWYNRAGRKMPDVSLKEEWKTLVAEFIALE